MDDLPRSSPPPPPEPTAHLILSLEGEPGGLLEEIAAWIRSSYSPEGCRAASDDDAWIPADMADPSPETLAVEERLVPTIDQIAAHNWQRVEERDRASGSPPAAESANEPAGAVGASTSIEEERIRHALQQCWSHNIHVFAEALDIRRRATTQRSHERSSEE